MSDEALALQAPLDSEQCASNMSLTAKPATKAMTLAFSIVVMTALMSCGRWIVAIATHRNQGLDPSDEAYYLASASNPGTAVARQSNFGFYVHLLLRAGGGSIGGLRLAGLVLLLASTATVSWAAMRFLPTGTVKSWRWLGGAAAWLCISSVTLTHYALWIVTPGYNLLALSAAMFILAGLVCGLAQESVLHAVNPWWRPVGCFVAVGCGVVVLADVKATSGLAVGLLSATILIAVLGTRGTARTAWSIAVGAVAGLLVNLVVVGSPVDTVTKIRRYAEMVSIDSSHESSAVWQTPFLGSTVLPWLGWFFLAVVTIVVAWRRISGVRARSLAMTVAAIAVSVALWGDRAGGGPEAFFTNGWWWLRLTTWTMLFVTALAPTPSRRLLIGPLLGLAALAVAIGSNNGLIRQTALTSGLLAVAVVAQVVIVAFSSDAQPLRALPALVFVLVTAWASFHTVPEAMSQPYRLGAPLQQSSVPVVLKGFGEVKVTPALADYIVGLQRISPLIPSDARDCMVDLSGNTPLSALALDARSATLPWVTGGYPGSSEALAFLLESTPCVGGRVLLVDAPDGPNRLQLPVVLRGRVSRQLGVVHFAGYVDEWQVVSILEAGTTRPPEDT